MQVAQILRSKGATVHSVAPGDSIADAIRALSQKRIGAVLVLGADDRVIGILSERDIVFGLAAHGKKLLGMQVSELMTRAVVSCRPENTVEEIMGEMTNRRFRHMPVVKDNRLIGVVSIGDVVKSRLEELSTESDMLRNYIAGA